MILWELLHTPDDDGVCDIDEMMLSASELGIFTSMDLAIKFANDFAMWKYSVDLNWIRDEFSASAHVKPKGGFMVNRAFVDLVFNEIMDTVKLVQSGG